LRLFWFSRPFTALLLARDDWRLLHRLVFWSCYRIFTDRCFVVFHKMKSLFFLCALFFSASAFSAIEQIPPASTLWGNGYPALNSPTAQGSCDLIQASVVWHPTPQVYYFDPVVITGYSAFCNTRYINGKQIVSSVAITQSNICLVASPSYTFNSSTGLCQRTLAKCTAPLVENPVTHICEDSCLPNKGKIAFTGLIDWGTDPNSSPPAGFTLSCQGGCSAIVDTGGGISSRYMISGVYHYYSVLQQSFTGDSCTSGTPTLANSKNPPNQSCASGQSLVASARTGVLCYGTPTASAVPATNPASGVSATNPASGVSATNPASGVSATNPASGVSATNPASGVSATCDPATDPNQCVTSCPAGDNSLKCMLAEPVINPQTIPTLSIPIDYSFTQVLFPSGGSCPAPRVLTVSRTPITISYQPLCDFLYWMRLAILAVAAYVAVFILTGHRTPTTD
jgi:hypothetical protein